MEPCYCNWNILGVEELPAHHHYQRYEGEPKKGAHLIWEIHIWVEWKEIAREYSAILRRNNGK